MITVSICSHNAGGVWSIRLYFNLTELRRRILHAATSLVFIFIVANVTADQYSHLKGILNISYILY